MRKCPYCAEEIQDEAIKCKYCKNLIEEVEPTLASSSGSTSSKKLPIYIIAAVLAVVGLVVILLVVIKSSTSNGSNSQTVPQTAPSPTTTAYPGEVMTVKVFFGNSLKDNPNSQDCPKIFPVERQVSKTLGKARAALEELFKGPSASERSQGFYTSINDGVVIKSLTIEDGLARADFSEQLIQNRLGGHCGLAMLYGQIGLTLQQFPSVKDVSFSINGESSEDVLEP